MQHKKKKRRHGLPPEEVNIVSLLDILTTLLFFILMVMSFSNFSIMEAEALLAGKPSEQKKNIFALRVIIQNATLATIQLGAIEGLKIANQDSFYDYLKKNYSGSPQIGFFKKLNAKNHTDLLLKIQDTLVMIKKGFPHEHKIVLAFSDQVEYQNMVLAMNEVQSLSDKRDAFQITTLVGSKEKTRILFPSVVLSEASGGMDKK
ncbi:MAG: hypothetical protein A2202_00300 [Bdellovibrionales bacterium RIFOXYA1_FULL_36_14]|nr:MAG: hypothetical protein A2202_00300 [Bdellovibrionales bacterium RIFOXYA1_FULL_36_14]